MPSHISRRYEDVVGSQKRRNSSCVPLPPRSLLLLADTTVKKQRQSYPYEELDGLAVAMREEIDAGAHPYEIEATSSCGWEPGGNLDGLPKVEGLPRQLGTRKAEDTDASVV